MSAVNIGEVQMRTFNFHRLAVLLVYAHFALTSVQAQQPPPPMEPKPPEHPAIENAALEILQATSQRVSHAKTLSFTAVTTYEAPARDGQPLFYATVSQVRVQRPNKLRVVTPGDGPPSEFYYNGKTITVYDPAAGLTAVTDAPPTIDAAMKHAYDTAAIYFPFTEVLVADPYKNLSQGLTTAYVVGQSRVVGDTITDIVAMANATVQAEVWIGINDGLPRLLRVAYPKDPSLSRHEIAFSNWRLNQPMQEADFTSERALQSPRMLFARPDAPPPTRP
jgi:hypothetical protein